MSPDASSGEPAYLSLYDHPIAARRTGPLFSAFPYATKIDPEAVALYIAAHTSPGDTVLDGFAGSGTTGVAACLCERPTDSMLAAAAAHGISPKWGPRKAVLYELSTLGAFIARSLTNPPDPTLFSTSAARLIDAATAELGWMYEAEAPDGAAGQIRHLIWSEQLICPACLRTSALWNAAVSLKPAKIASIFACPACQFEAPLTEVPRVTAPAWDDLLQDERIGRTRQPAHLYGRTGSRTWSRPVISSDLRRLETIAATPIPASVPVEPIPWGDLYRTGYHQGMTHLHHFYSRRNLIAFTWLWEAAGQAPVAVVDGLRFWLLGYNASHATVMTRVVAKQNMPDLVVTSAQPGVLYVSGLPVEKNLFAGLRRRAAVVADAFRQTSGCQSHVEVRNSSSRQLHLKDESVDYIFTDPPFGGNIPYSEVNFVNEAWLDAVTDATDEVVVSKHQRKDVSQYQALMTNVFSEFYRVLKPSARGTVVFHSAAANIWNALKNAYQGAGFRVERTSILDKLQGSFKQVTTVGAVKGDPTLLLKKEEVAAPSDTVRDWRLIATEWLASSQGAAGGDPRHLYSRLVGHYLRAHREVPVSAGAFYQWCREQVEKDGVPIPAE